MFRVFMSGPGVEIIVIDERVQGDGAATSIANGIRVLDGKVDIIIFGRGGGSMEDLWAFNEEELARAVFACKTPIISAVGHEVDEVITDYVADRRVSTPTAAAELVVQNMAKVVEEYRLCGESIRSAIEDNMHNARQVLDGYDMPMWKKIVSSRLEMSRKTIEGLSAGLDYSLSSGIARAKETIATADTELRTTWVAAIHENGLAALYQNGARVKDAATFKKGKFEAMLKDGKITGEVKKIEV
jgi:exodeoxyribonuclease VII large subunit